MFTLLDRLKCFFLGHKYIDIKPMNQDLLKDIDAFYVCIRCGEVKDD